MPLYLNPPLASVPPTESWVRPGEPAGRRSPGTNSSHLLVAPDAPPALLAVAGPGLAAGAVLHG